jgi:hypothetical protein
MPQQSKPRRAKRNQAVQIPDADAVRTRLAKVVIEAAHLRAQLRVSKRLEREKAGR